MRISSGAATSNITVRTTSRAVTSEMTAEIPSQASSSEWVVSRPTKTGISVAESTPPSTKSKTMFGVVLARL